MKKTITAVSGALLGVVLLAGCTETYTFEAEPKGGSKSDPRDIDCFTIEADAEIEGDDGDIQLGTFCREGSR